MQRAFVIPVYNERETLETLAAGIRQHAGDDPFRILFVDDGSTDGSFEVIGGLRERFDDVDAIRLRRNFGKTQALAAAFAHADADVVCTLDADLQDDPEEIPKLLAKLEEGWDMVCGWKAERRDPWHKILPSRVYNALIARTFQLDLHDVNTGFKAMRMEVAQRLPLYGEMHRMMAVFAAAQGYRVTEVAVRHHPRRHGRSKFGIERFSRGAFDGLAAWFLTRYGQSPSHAFGLTGIFATVFGLLAFALGIGGAVALWWGETAAAGGEPNIRAIALLVWFALSFVILAWGSLAFMAALVGELIVYRAPRVDPETYIAEARIGPRMS